MRSNEGDGNRNAGEWEERLTEEGKGAGQCGAGADLRHNLMLTKRRAIDYIKVGQR